MKFTQIGSRFVDASRVVAVTDHYNKWSGGIDGSLVHLAGCDNPIYMPQSAEEVVKTLSENATPAEIERRSE